jgi:hypothetical protein
MPCCHSLKNLNPAERLRTAESLLKLRSRLDGDIPQKTVTDTLLPVTWNICEFGDNRSQESLFFPAGIISRFDLVALQEVSASLGGLEKLMKLPNPQWDCIAAGSTEGGGEKTVFLYDRRKVSFRSRPSSPPAVACLRQPTD